MNTMGYLCTQVRAVEVEIKSVLLKLHMSLTRSGVFSDALSPLCKLGDHVVNVVDVTVDIANAVVLVVILAHVWGRLCVRSITLERAQFLHET